MSVTVTSSTVPSTIAQPGQGIGQDGLNTGDLFAELFGAQLAATDTKLPGVKLGAKEDLLDSTGKNSILPLAQDANNTLMQPSIVVALAQVAQPQSPIVDLNKLSDTSALNLPTAKSKVSVLLIEETPLPSKAGANEKKLPEQAQVFAQLLPVQQGVTAAQKHDVADVQPKQLSIPLPMTDSNWSKALGDQMMAMVSLKADKAHIQVNPPQLGPIEVSLKMNGTDQAQVIFTAAVPATREILEQNMPKLVSMMAGSGIQLADAQVSSGQSGQSQQFFARHQNGRRADDGKVEEIDTLSSIKASRGVLSIFA